MVHLGYGPDGRGQVTCPSHICTEFTGAAVAHEPSSKTYWGLRGRAPIRYDSESCVQRELARRVQAAG